MATQGKGGPSSSGLCLNHARKYWVLKSVHQDWFSEISEEINASLQEKHKAYIEWQNDDSKKDNFKRLQSKVQRKLRYMEDKW